MNFIVVFATTPTKEDAKKIARKIVDEGLAACVSIVDEVKSIFYWEGKIEKAREAMLIIKTRNEKFNQLMDHIKSIHPYTVPEILAIPILAGNPEYLKWVEDSTRRKEEKIQN